MREKDRDWKPQMEFERGGWVVLSEREKGKMKIEVKKHCLESLVIF